MDQRLQLKLITVFIFIISILPSTRSIASDTSNNYKITIDEANPLNLHISAVLFTEGDTLFMNANCPNYDFPEGWATFIKNLEISTPNGEGVSHKYLSKSKWIIDRRKEKVLILEYDVDLSFTKLKWDVGNEQAGFTDGESVYIVSKAVFIYAGKDMDSKVSFNIPSSWNIATPWRPEGVNEFDVPSNEFLIENSLVYGNFHISRYTEGVFQFTVALLGTAKKDSELFCSTLSKITKAYIEVFDKTHPTNYLLTMFYNDIDDGESFFNSLAFTLKNPIEETNKIIWANQMAHELFHYWNSDLIQAESYSERQWFSEGTAEYYANMTLVREGIISESMFTSKMEKVLGLYQNYRGWTERETSILDAGKNKGRHRFLVYNGGWAIAMALEVEIMENTEGRKNLNDFMRLLFERYTIKPYTYKDLVRTASEIGEMDLGPFFKKYVEGTELLPLGDYMNRLGYIMSDIIYEAEIYLVKKSNDKLGLNNQWLKR